MLIEMRPVTSIRPYENNPRLNDDGVEAVARSIQEFGFRQPIVVDEDGVIIVGHTRYKAAIKLGLETVPVHVAVGLSPEQARAYRLADNQTATLSHWDDDKLPFELAELQRVGLRPRPDWLLGRRVDAAAASRPARRPDRCRRRSRTSRRGHNPSG